MAIKAKKGDCIEVRNYGALYIVDSWRESDGAGLRWTAFSSINGKDGISYSFTDCEIVRKLTREEFDVINSQLSDS